MTLLSIGRGDSTAVRHLSQQCPQPAVQSAPEDLPGIGLVKEFRSEKIPRNRLGTVSIIPRNRLGRVSIIPRKKVLIPRHSEFRGRSSSEVRNRMERNSAKKWSFTEPAQPLWSLWRPLHSTLRSFLFRGMVHNGIPGVCFHFCSTELNFELFSLPLKNSEGNSENLLPFWLHGTVFQVVFFSAEGFGRKFREFASIFFQRNGISSCYLFRGIFGTEFRKLSIPRNRRNSIGKNHLFRLFRLPPNYFFVGNSQPYYQGRLNPSWEWIFALVITTEDSPLIKGDNSFLLRKAGLRILEDDKCDDMVRP